MSLEDIVRLAVETALTELSNGRVEPGPTRSFVEAFAARLEHDSATERLGTIARQALATKGAAG